MKIFGVKKYLDFAVAMQYGAQAHHWCRKKPPVELDSIETSNGFDFEMPEDFISDDRGLTSSLINGAPELFEHFYSHNPVRLLGGNASAYRS